MPHDEPTGPDLAGTPAGGEPQPGGRAEDGFRLLVVPGVSPGKWLGVWHQRLPGTPVTLVHATADGAAAALLAGDADAGLVRLPVDRDRLSAIPLYTETTVVVVPTDHLVAAADDVVAADLADEVLLVPADDVLPWPDRPGEPSAMAPPATTGEAVEQVASGVGVLVVPQSLARVHHRRDVTYRPVTDAPTSSVGLAWRSDATTDLVEELIGIVRGRTVNSSRGRAGASPAAPEPAPEPGARRRGAGGAGSAGSAQGAGGRTAGRTSGRPAGGRGTAGGPAAGGRSGAAGSRPGRSGGGRPRRRG